MDDFHRLFGTLVVEGAGADRRGRGPAAFLLSSQVPMGTSTTAASSTAAGGGFGGRLCLPSRAPIAFVGLWAWATGPVRGPSERAGHASAAAASSWRENRSGEQDHYEVLGLPRSASNTAIKRAYRLLARKVPDLFHHCYPLLLLLAL